MTSRRVLVCGVGLLCLAAWMRCIDGEIARHCGRHGGDARSIVDFEFVFSTGALEARLDPKADRTQDVRGATARLVRSSLAYDLPFIALYATCLLWVTRRRGERSGWRPVTVNALSRLILLAAGCDVVEDVALWIATSDSPPPGFVPPIVGVTASLKFALLLAWVAITMVVPAARWLRREWRPVADSLGDALAWTAVVRVPSSGALFLVLIPAVMGGAAISAGVMALPSRAHLFVCGLALGLAAITCVSNALLTARYAPSRFSVPRLPWPSLHEIRPRRSQDLVQFVVAVALSVPFVGMMHVDGPTFDGFAPVITSLGVVVSIGLVISVQRAVLGRAADEAPAPEAPPQAPQSPRPLAWIWAGYWSPEGGLLPGHRGAAAAWSVLGAAFIAGNFLVPDGAGVDSFPTLAAVLFLATLVIATLSGLSFFLDRARFPLLLAVLLWTLVSGISSHSTHYFFLTSEARREAIELPTVATTLAARAKDEGISRQPTVVVVCTAGGGIQAAGWTAEVLTELDAIPRFAPRLALLSSVSGGSVGAMYYVEALRRRGRDSSSLTPAARKRVREVAMRSSLNAVGWATVFKDIRRPAMPLRWLVDLQMDRGIALERSWQRQFTGDGDGVDPPLDATLGDWVTETKSGRIPPVVFNATLGGVHELELKGQRLMLSTIDLTSSESDLGRAPNFFRVFGRASDIAIVTAARLSASFPYVSPLSRAARVEEGRVDPIAPGYYVGDGGYFDNYGVATVLDWLLRTLDVAEPPRIAVVQIQSFPDAPPTTADAGQVDAWRNALLGPLDLLLATWRRTQLVRAEIERDLVARHLKGQIEFFRFVPEGLTQTPPLSWHLTTREKDAIRGAFQDKNRNAQAKLLDFLERR